MKIYLRFVNEPDENDSISLQQLANLLEKECNAEIQTFKSEPKAGVKDAGLTIGIAIAGLGLSTISTLISVLTYWKSQQPKYSLHLCHGQNKLIIDNLKPKEIDEMFAKLASQKSQVEILIS